MNKWYTSLLKKIKNSGNRVFLTDTNSLLNDRNFCNDLSSLFTIHKYKNESEFYLFLEKHENENILIYSKEDNHNTYIQDNFDNFDLNLSSIFPGLELNILNNMDVSYLQQIYDHYNLLKSKDIHINTKSIIFKSIWNLNPEDLYSPTENLKIILSYLIDKKDFDTSILETISKNLSINLNNFDLENWIEDIIINYISSINKNSIPKFDLSDNLIQFYLSKISFNKEKIAININQNTLKSAPWLSLFIEESSDEITKNKINNDIIIFKNLLNKFKDGIDLNQIDNIFYLSRLFFKIFYNIQFHNFKFSEFCDIESCYLRLSNIFKLIVEEKIFETLLNFHYNKRPYTINKLLNYTSHKLKDENLAIIIFDGMSFDEWFILKKFLNNFKIKETESFAILPTITQFSRTSMLTNSLPKSFMQDNKPNYNKIEEEGFKNYFKSIKINGNNIAESDILFGRVNPNNDYIKTKKEKHKFEHLKGYNVIGLISNLFDDLSHDVSVYGDMKSNLYKNIKSAIESSNILHLLEKLKDFGYKIVISSDHGNIFCKGNDIKYNKNLQIDKKSKRTLIFNEEIFADNILRDNPEQVIKYNSNKVYPNDYFFILACENYFFANKDNFSITHGSFMPEEWIVPVVILE